MRPSACRVIVGVSGPVLSPDTELFLGAEIDLRTEGSREEPQPIFIIFIYRQQTHRIQNE